MEKTLCDVRSDMVMALMCREGGRRFPRQLSFCGGGGLSIKSSYHAARSSSEGIGLTAPKKLPGNNFSSINGSNGSTSSWTSSRVGFVLDTYEDEYGGIIINPDRLPQNASVFSSVLQASLSHWKQKGKKGIWLKLSVDYSELVPVAVKEGFSYHHAEKSYVMLTYWIPDEPCLLPANASHQVGVGGFVINEKHEVLVVQEKHCDSFGSAWKLPTGFVHESEEIFAGAVREVKEETGIDTEFVEVIAFRHAHNVAFEKSDLFFICMLRPLSTQIVIDELEIQAAKETRLIVHGPWSPQPTQTNRVTDLIFYGAHRVTHHAFSWRFRKFRVAAELLMPMPMPGVRKFSGAAEGASMRLRVAAFGVL